MLTDLFRLDGSPTVHQQGTVMPSMSPDDLVSNTLFQGDRWYAPRKMIKKVTFRNVSMAKMEFLQLTFTECIFEDCLLFTCHFREVEFHKCQFINCNFWKAKFDRCYLDPDTIRFDERYRIDAANVGVTMYQALISNYADERQDDFFMLADIQFRRWKRYQLDRDIREKNVDRWPAKWRRFKSLMYDLIAGYGYKPGCVFLITVIGFFLISVFNHCIIGGNLLVNGVRPNAPTFVDSIFYSFSVLTVLGFSTVVPDGAGAKLLTVFEALAAIGWLSIFTSVLVKRFLR